MIHEYGKDVRSHPENDFKNLRGNNNFIPANDPIRCIFFTFLILYSSNIQKNYKIKVLSFIISNVKQM